MKRHGHLYLALCSFDFLMAAARRAARRKRHRPDVAGFLFRRESQVLDIQRRLLGRTWEPAGYRQFVVREPKPRTISAAPFRDRVVHHALVSSLEPVFEPTFIFHSYASRVGKGSHRAVRQYQSWSRSLPSASRGGVSAAPWALKLDVAQFFPSLDHSVLWRLLARKIKDQDMLRLLEVVIRASPPSPHGPGKGLPIGNQTSQFWANVYLNPLDHYLTEVLGCRRYLRYMDDMVVLGSNPADLRVIQSKVAEFLGERLKLRLAPHKCYVAPARAGLSLLGYRVFPERIRLLRPGVVRVRRRLKRLQRELAEGRVSLERVRSSVAGWLGHARQADAWRLCSSILENAPFRLPDRQGGEVGR